MEDRTKPKYPRLRRLENPRSCGMRDPSASLAAFLGNGCDEHLHLETSTPCNLWLLALFHRNGPRTICLIPAWQEPVFHRRAVPFVCSVAFSPYSTPLEESACVQFVLFRLRQCCRRAHPRK